MNFFNISKNLLLVAVLFFSFSACTDLAVNEVDSQITETATGDFMGDPTQLLSSAYNDLGSFTDQANIYALGAHTSDEMIPPTRGVDWGDNGVWRTLHAHTWDPTHSFVLTAWNQLNGFAFKCNQILASSPSAQEAAEAKFLRAFFTYHVMDFYGQVPFRGVNEGVEIDPKVFTRREAFDFIMQDLTEALPDLPTAGPSATNTVASKAAARALMARLHLNRAVYSSDTPEGPYNFDAGDMTKVVELADAITADGYGLEGEYFTNFSTGATSEVIFTSGAGSPQNRYFMTLHYNQNPSGWNGFTTLADFYNKFDANDSRIGNYPAPDGTEFSGIGRGFLIGQQYDDAGTAMTDTRTQKPLSFTEDVPLSGAATDKGIRVIKYHPSNKGNYILFRYADVLLMKAEAIHRGGTSGDNATDIINNLRTTRGADILGGTLTDADILDERGRELYWEGLRRIDQIRFGTYTSTWHEKTSTEAFRVLFPIPQQALDSNPNLVQNAGY